MPIRGLRAEAYKSGKAVLENDFLHSSRWELLPSGHAPLQNVLFAPMVLEGSSVGLLGLGNKPEGFSEDDLRMASAFAEFGAIGLMKHQMLESLRYNEEQFRSVFQTANDAIICVDERGNVVLWNNAAEEIFGYNPQEALGEDLGFIMPRRFKEAHMGGFCRMIDSVRDGRLSQVHRIVGRRKDTTEFPAELSVAVWESKGGNFFTGIVRDVSERAQREEKLQSALSELERSNAELQQFAYVASHDLQEPLRMVSSYVRLLERRYKSKLDSDADDFIQFAVDGAQRMQRLIDDLLRYSRVGTRGKEFCDVNPELILNQVLANLKVTIQESGAQVHCGSLPTIKGDATQLMQLFQNVIENAIKFRNNEPPEVRISAERADDFWRFSITDNGIGIDPQYHERVFSIFQRLHSRDQYPGTGIGLAICKKIVERHSGRIWIQSEEGAGTSFFFTIPY